MSPEAKKLERIISELEKLSAGLSVDIAPYEKCNAELRGVGGFGHADLADLAALRNRATEVRRVVGTFASRIGPVAKKMNGYARSLSLAVAEWERIAAESQPDETPAPKKAKQS